MASLRLFSSLALVSQTLSQDPISCRFGKTVAFFSEKTSEAFDNALDHILKHVWHRSIHTLSVLYTLRRLEAGPPMNPHLLDSHHVLQRVRMTEAAVVDTTIFERMRKYEYIQQYIVDKIHTTSLDEGTYKNWSNFLKLTRNKSISLFSQPPKQGRSTACV